jgi:hypothetical protein
MAKFEFIFDDDHYRDIADLLIGLRDAKQAFEACRGKIEEWDSFSAEIRRGQYGGAPLSVLIEEVESWSQGWWRRANARTQRPRETPSDL